MDERKIINRLSSVGIVGNIILVLFKLYAGFIGRSAAMVSDAIHSLSDVFATFIAMIGVRISRKAPDDDHPYGHDRFECLASLALGVILVGTGLGIGISGIKTVIGGNYDSIEVPSLIALIAAIVSIVTKEAMFHYTMHYAKKLNSSAFKADAWHHRSDALSSVGSLIGIGGAMLGFPVLDSVACIGICICILKVGFDILRDAASKMIDKACSPEFEAELKSFIEEQEGVDHLDILATREFGDGIYIDAEISAEGSLTLEEAHRISEEVHDAVEKKYPRTKHIMIHVNPTSEANHRR